MSLASPLIEPATLEARLGDPSLVVVDVRHDLTQPDTWGESQYRAAHVPGALFAHIERDLSGPKTGRNGRHPLPSVGEAAAVFSRYGIDGTKDVVAYDQGGGMYAARLWWMLRWLGHDSVAVLDGGFERWQRERRPVDATIPSAKAARFEARIGGATLQATDVQRVLGDPAWQLVDARIPERYRGEVEPLDPVAGHIPGAVNRPYGRNLDEDGSFKEPSRLRDEFRSLLGGRPVERMVHYCGSGVTACHNLLALEVAGLPGARIYPGSWSEWVADPSRPVAVGDEGAQSSKMPRRLEGRHALVTGAARGIGLAIAERLAAEGATLTLVDLSQSVESAAATIADADFAQADVSRGEDVQRVVGETVARHGRIDILVNNAGILHAAEFLDVAEDDFDRVLRVNVKSVFLCGQAVARSMVEGRVRGAIVNLSSVNAVLAIPTQVPYTASKGAVNQLTKVMALALAPHGIRVNAIGPGTIDTEMTKGLKTDEAARQRVMSRTPMKRVGEPSEIAAIAAFLASDDASYLTGQTIYPDGGRLGLNYTMPD